MTQLNIRHWFFIALPFFLVSSKLYSAGVPLSVQKVNLTKDSGREILLIDHEKTTIELTGLVLGTQYDLMFNPEDQVKDIAILIQDINGMVVGNEGVYTFTAKGNSKTIVLISKTDNVLHRDVVFLSYTTTTAYIKENTFEQAGAISTDYSFSTNQLVEEVFVGGNCYEVDNISSTGDPQSRGTFSNGQTSISIEEGILISSGKISNASGPNNASGESTKFNLLPGFDPDLAAITSGDLYDISIIEFDFTPSSDYVQFEYVFASEEYCEYVGSQFNDIFGFFISGPGINGPFSNGAENIAILPGSNTAVAINNVNHTLNTNYYKGNIPKGSPQLGDVDCENHPITGPPSILDCEFDGYTVVLTAGASVIPCQTYHIKLAIADVADAIFDSAVFLKGNSFNSGSSVAVRAVGVVPDSNVVYEGCGGGYFEFIRSGDDISQPATVYFSISNQSTATMGVDYPVLPSSIVIPAGQTSYKLYVEAFADLEAEGYENILLELAKPCLCNNPFVEMVLYDPPTVKVDLDDQYFCDIQPLTLSPYPSGGVAPYTYLWSTGATTSSITVTPTGLSGDSYSVTITDACGNEGSKTVKLIKQQTPTAIFQGNASLCEGQGGKAKLTVLLSGTGPWVFEYAQNGVVQPAVTSYDNAYTLWVDALGEYELISVFSGPAECEGIASGLVEVTLKVFEATATGFPVRCYNGMDGQIELTLSGGDAPYTFNWTNGVPDEQNPDSLAAGTYVVTITDADGCKDTAQAIIDSVPPIQIMATEIVHVDCNESAGSIDLSVSGGVGGYSCFWLPIDTILEDPQGLMPGFYGVEVTDSNGCVDSLVFEVEDRTALPVVQAAASDSVDCIVNKVVLNATGSTEGPEMIYLWGGITGTLEGEVDSMFALANGPGIYYLEVLNSLTGCANTDTVEVFADTLPPYITATADTLDCQTAEVTIDGSGSGNSDNLSYFWQTNDGQILEGEGSLTPLVGAAGTYSLTLTDTVRGCFSVLDVPVLIDTIRPLAIVSPAVITCQMPEPVLSGEGSSAAGNQYVYLWETTTGNIIEGEETLFPSVDQPGEYTLIVSNTNNGCSSAISVEVGTDLVAPEVVIPIPDTLTCALLSTMLTAMPQDSLADYQYQWETTTGNILDGESTANPQVDAPGLYILELTNNENGCSSLDTVEVIENTTVPVLSALEPEQIDCGTDSVQIEVAASVPGGGLLIFEWTTLDGNILDSADAATVWVDAVGEYSLTATNYANGCESVINIDVSEDFSMPDVSILTPDVITCAVSGILLDGSNSSAGGNFQYQWYTMDGQLTGATDLPSTTVGAPGVYSLSITDLTNECVASESVTVVSDTLTPTIDAGATDTLNCVISSVQLEGAGNAASGDFDLLWTTADGHIVEGEDSFTPQVDVPGTYTLVITDNVTGCSASSSTLVIMDSVPPVANPGPAKTLTCDSLSVQLDGSSSIGDAMLQWNWSTTDGTIAGDAGQAKIIAESTGTYTLTVTNSNNGCSASADIFVEQNTVTPIIEYLSGDSITCKVPEISLFAEANTESGLSTIEWMTTEGNIISGDSSFTPVISEGGIYTLLVKDPINGCLAVDSLEVEDVRKSPNIIIADPSMLSCEQHIVWIDATDSDYGTYYSCKWETTDGLILSGQDSLEMEVGGAGNYSITVTNKSNGCTASAEVVVGIDTIRPTIELEGSLLTCRDTAVALSASGSSVGPNYALLWTTVDGHILSDPQVEEVLVDEAGTYFFSIENTENGCTNEASILLEQDISQPVAQATGGVLTCADSLISLDGAGSSEGGGNFTYLWETNNGVIIEGEATLLPLINAPGVYQLTVTSELNGCTSAATVEVEEDVTLPEVVVLQPDVINCTVGEVMLSGEGSSEEAFITYAWSTVDGLILEGADLLQATAGAGGTYVLTVANANNGCLSSDSVQVVVDTAVPEIIILTPEELTCTVEEVILDASSSSSGDNFSYHWTSDSGQLGPNTEEAVTTVYAPGFYTIELVNEDNTCRASSTVEVTIDTLTPLIDAGESKQLTCVFTSAILNGTAEAGQDNLIFEWSTTNGSFLSETDILQPEVGAAGIYTLTATNAENGCMAQSEVEVILDDNLPVADAGTSQTLTCYEGQLVLGGNTTSIGSEFSYLWSTSDGNMLSDVTLPQITVDEAGTYVLTVTNLQNGCFSSSSVIVTNDIVYPELSVTAPAYLDCSSPQAQIVVDIEGDTSGLTITWISSPDDILAGLSQLNPIVEMGGVYEIEVSNPSNGCSVSSSVTIENRIDYPIAIINPADTINCYHPETSLDATSSIGGAAVTIDWQTDGGTIISGAEGYAPIVGAGGLYTLILSNTYNHCADTASIVVEEQTALPVMTIATPFEINCAVSAVMLQATIENTAYLSFNWSTTDGHFQDGMESLSPVVDEAGNYTLEVMNLVSGCKNSESITVIADLEKPMVDAGIPDTITCYEPVISLNGGASDSTDSMIFEWSTVDGFIINNGNTLYPEISQPGMYILMLTNQDNYCVSADTVQIYENTILPEVSAGEEQLMGCVTPTLLLEATAWAYSEWISYSWETSEGHIINGANSSIAEIDTGGLYTILVTDLLNGCQAIDDVEIIFNRDLPLVDAGADGELNCSTTDFLVNAQADGNVSDFVYEWQYNQGNIVSGGNTLKPLIDAPGTYTLVVTDTYNGCQASDEIEVIQDEVVPQAIVTIKDTLTCAVPAITLDGSLSSQSPTIIYKWSTSNGNILSGEGTLYPVINQGGFYTLTLIDGANNCMGTHTVEVVPDTAYPQITIGLPDTLNCAHTEITLDGGVTSTGIPYMLSWNTDNGQIVSGDNTLTPKVDAPGSYMLEVTYLNNGCKTTEVISVEQDIQYPVIEIPSPDTLTCATLSASLSAGIETSGALFSLTWTTMDGIIEGSATTLTTDVSSSGWYFIQVENDKNGCTSVDSVFVYEDVVHPHAEAGKDYLLNCYQGEMLLNGVGSSIGSMFNYTWTTQDGIIVDGEEGLAPLIAAPGLYYLTVKNTNNGCYVQDTAEVAGDFDFPKFSISTPPVLNCTYEEVSLEGKMNNGVGGAFQFLWTTNDGNIVSGMETLTPVVDTPGLYRLTVINMENGCADTSNVLVQQDIVYPYAQADVFDTLTCTNTTINLDATESAMGPGIIYSWSSQTGAAIPNPSSLTPMVSVPGWYQLAVINKNNGCISYDTLFVNQDVEAPVAVASVPDLLTCTNQSMVLNGEGSSFGPFYQYEWTTTDGEILAGMNTLSPLVNAPGLYSLLVVNQKNGCTNETNVTVNQDTVAPLIILNNPDLLTCVKETVNLNATGSSTGPQFINNWTAISGNILSGDGTPVIVVDEPGVYIYNVANTENGCVTIDTVVVSQNIEAPAADAGNTGTLTCSLQNMSLTGAAFSNFGQIVWQWTTIDGHIVSGMNSLTPLIDEAGTYQFTVTDIKNGCTAADEVTIGLDTLSPFVLIAEPGLLTCAKDSIKLDATDSDNGIGFNFEWTTFNGNIINGAATLSPTINKPGIYTLQVTSQDNGCTGKDAVNVLEDKEKPQVDAGETIEFPCYEDQISLLGIVAVELADVGISWFTPDGVIADGGSSLSPFIMSGGTYIMQVINLNNGCIAFDSVEVLENKPGDLELEGDNPPCVGDPGALRVTHIEGGTPPYLFSLNDSESYVPSMEFGGLEPGWHSVKAQDMNGCETEEASILIEHAPELQLLISGDADLNMGEDFQIEVQVNFPEDEITLIQWSNPSTLSCTDCLDPYATPLESSEYTVRVENKNGCPVEGSIRLFVDERTRIYIPNAFSPDGDGSNDVFMIFAPEEGVRKINTFKVFDRWGEMVFEYNNFKPNDPAAGWDGTYRGELLKPQVLVWYAEIEMINGDTRIMEGDLTLIR